MKTDGQMGSDRKIKKMENVSPNIDGLRIVTRKILAHSWANVIKPHRSASASASASSAFFALRLIVGRQHALGRKLTSYCWPLWLSVSSTFAFSLSRLFVFFIRFRIHVPSLQSRTHDHG